MTALASLDSTLPPTPSRAFRGLRTALVACLLVAASGCERVEVDPSVAEGPLPSPGDPVDPLLADAGAELFQRRCVACHRLEGQEVVGPNLANVATRRDYAWIRAMVLSPDSMLRADSVARALLDRYKVPMTDTGLDEARFRAVLEFLRRAAEGRAEEGDAVRPPGASSLAR